MPETEGWLHAADFARPGRLDGLLAILPCILEAGGGSVKAARTLKRDGPDRAPKRRAIGRTTPAGRTAVLPPGSQTLLGATGARTARD